ncbi:immunoglobulin domain-containing protein [Thiolapillus sp.]|uniref:immunoglobulin domain-containing protein n=1 Tax=Thiolapillus sp. TaxID=2017437 RepID=UPI0035AC25AB
MWLRRCFALFCAVVPQAPTISSSASGTVEDGSSFTLTCQTASTGITSATYIWNVGGTDQAATASSTLIQTADINNVLAYTCKVSADGGTDYSAVTTSSFSHSGRCRHFPQVVVLGFDRV